MKRLESVYNKPNQTKPNQTKPNQTKQKYSTEFKENAVKRANEQRSPANWG
jgi:transposase-like protein